MNKGGQVFLMATIIIVGIMLGLVRISNKSIVREEPKAFFDLADEIGFETKRVLDYGVINLLSSGDIDNHARRLLENYSELISNEDVAFVYGNSTNVSAYYYQNINVQAISLSNNVFVTLPVTTGTPIEAKYEETSKEATVRIRNNDYAFNLKPGQNFYFVLIKDEEDEQFVTVK